MVEISITKISSKGQVVIPQEMRDKLKEGDNLVVIKNDGRIILKKMEDFNKNLREDLEFAKRTEKAWKRYDRGEFISMDAENFLKEIKKW